MTEVVNETDDLGKVELPTWAKVLADVPCMLQTGQSQQAPDGSSGLIYDESDNLFTLDALRMEAGIDVRVGDVIFQSAGTEAGSWFTARGNPQVRLRLNYQETLCSRTPIPPAGISA
jgi:hypothetical protein